MPPTYAQLQSKHEFQYARTSSYDFQYENILFVANSSTILGSLLEDYHFDFQPTLIHPNGVLLNKVDVQLLDRSSAVMIEWANRGIHALVKLKEMCSEYPRPVYVFGELDDFDKVAALKLGADECLSVPMPKMLFDTYLEKNSVLRKLDKPTPKTAAVGTGIIPSRHLVDVVDGEDLNLMASTRQLNKGAKTIQLGAIECEILGLFLSRPGESIRRDDLIEHVWSSNYEIGPNVVDVHIYSIRKKLRSLGINRAIETIRGVGYRWRL